MVHANRIGTSKYNPKAKPAKGKASRAGLWHTSREVLLFLGRFLVIFAVMGGALSYLMFGNVTFNYKLPSVTKLKHKYFHKELVFTPETLKEFDGSDPTKPIYLAVLGKVYDVTAGRDHYGPGGGYSFFSGRDAGRAFITGCFETHLTPDLRGLSAEQMKGVDEWREFYDNHDQYFYVGKVIHPPIDPNTPIPRHCDEEPEAGGLAGTGGDKPVDKKSN